MGKNLKTKFMKRVYILFIVSGFVLSIITCENDRSYNGDSAGKGGSTARFTIAANNLYTVSNEELKVFDLTDASNPEPKGTTSLGFGIETIFPYGNHLFIGTQTGMKIIDITDPDHPLYVSEYEHIYSCDPVVVEGSYAYVTLNSLNSWCGRNVNRLEIIDISDLYNPNLIKQYNMESPLGLGIDENLLFVCDNGLKVYDVTDKLNAKLLYHYSIKANDVIPYGNILLVTGNDGLYQYRYNAGEITLLSKLSIERTKN